MRAILVSVDYADLLAVTLPHNRYHFDEVMVVTYPGSKDAAVALANDCKLHETEAFYRNGATFNKWLALEEGLDDFGRHGWMCLMDADVVWPKRVTMPELDHWKTDTLYSPLRHMMVDLPTPFVLPPENEWVRYPIHRNVNEWAGYTQIFHANDPHLPKGHWHETNWRHAGGADSFFQRLWPASHKVRTPWNVLHLGEAGTNWCGRATKFLDGTQPEGGQGRKDMVRAFVRSRRPGAPDPYADERV